jgi:hypothetical protein
MPFQLCRLLACSEYFQRSCASWWAVVDRVVVLVVMSVLVTSPRYATSYSTCWMPPESEDDVDECHYFTCVPW